MRHRFEGFELDTADCELRRGGVIVPLQPKVFDLLAYLVANAGRLVTREEILGAVWPDVHVGDDALKQIVRKLRQALGDDAASPRFIEAVPRRGYRFAAAVEAAAERPRSDLVGRDADLGRLDEALERSRFVVVRGPGGIGKTALITTWARVRADTRQVDAAALPHLHGLLFSIAHALRVPIESDDAEAVRRLGLALGAARATLVVDGMEGLADAAWVLQALAASGRVVATSRVALQGGLDLELAPLGADDGVALFTRRAGLDPRAATAPVRALVDKLDGNPLAIELAAARLPVARPEDLLARVQDQLRWLRRPGAVGRHASMEATLEWSWGLLEPWAQASLAQIAVFPTSFSLEDAEAVLDPPGVADAPEVLDAVQALAACSLLAVGSGERRFRVADSVRAFARSRGGDCGPYVRRLVARALAIAEPLSAEAYGCPSVAGLDELAAVLPMLGAARDPAVEASARARASLVSWELFKRRGPWSTSDPLMVQVFEDRARLDPPLRLDVLRTQLDLLRRLGRTAAAAAVVDEIIALEPDVPAPAYAHARLYVAMLRSDQGDRPRALAEIQAYIPALRALHLPGGYMRQGVVLRLMGRPAECEAAWAMGLAACTGKEHTAYRVGIAGNYGVLMHERGRYLDAEARYRWTLETAASAGMRTVELSMLTNLGNLCAEVGRTAEADRWFDQANALARAIGAEQQVSSILGARAFARVLEGSEAAAWALSGELLDRARASNRRGHEAWALGLRAMCAWSGGRPEEALALAQNAAELATEDRYACFAALITAASLAAVDRVDEAEVAAAEVARLAPRCEALLQAAADLAPAFVEAARGRRGDAAAAAMARERLRAAAGASGALPRRIAALLEPVTPGDPGDRTVTVR